MFIDRETILRIIPKEAHINLSTRGYKNGTSTRAVEPVGERDEHSSTSP
jgi:hypothetical protein